MPPAYALPRHRRTVLLSLALLCLGGAVQAQGTPPTLLPLGMTSAILTGNSVVLFSIAAAFPPAPQQTGRCRPLAGGATLSGTNPPAVTGLAPGAPYTCELEFSQGGPSSLGAATPPVVIVPDGLSGPAPTAADAVTGLQATPAPTSLRLDFTPPAAPGAAIGGYAAVCIDSFVPPPPPLVAPAPARYLIALGAGSPITLHGLDPGSRYECSVLPYNGSGIAPLGAGALFTTLAAPPPAAQPVPALSGWGLLLMPLALLGALAGRRGLQAKLACSARQSSARSY